MVRGILLVGVVAVVWTPARTATFTDAVQTDSGPIRGEELTFEGTKYKAFKGVPYAAPPIEDLKFKAPQPPQKWTEVRNATSYGKICPQPYERQTSSEDCLTLNVYTTSLDENDLKPVLVWIHGGGFSSGDGTDDFFGPQYLIQQDIVVVTFNYRIGPLGFLATNSSDATGNWGLKDQVAALKWVQANIDHFGGNPKAVTIYGASAGGVSVHLHLFSPLSTGLFHKAIAASGSVSNPWALNTPDQQHRYSRNLARLLGASEGEIEDPEKRVRFLRAADSKELTKVFLKVLEDEDTSNPLFNPIPFAPVIEAPGTEGAFLTNDPKTLLSEGKFAKVPMMMGVNDLEGGLSFLGYGKDYTPQARIKIEQNVCEILPEPLKDAVIAKGDCSKIAQQIRDAYFDGKSFDSSLLNFVYLWGDLFITKDMYFSQRIHAQHAGKDAALYNYYFTFDGQWNIFKGLNNITLPGAIHGDEILYVFIPRVVDMPTLPLSSPEVITKNRMISFLTNFVKFGNPTPSVSEMIPAQWEPCGKKEFNTMVIGNDLKLEKEFLKTRMGLWDKLYKEYSGETSALAGSSMSGFRTSELWLCCLLLVCLWANSKS